MSSVRNLRKAIFGYDIFISYSRKDGLDYAYAIAQYFMKKGYECYIDQLSSISPGAALPQNIKEAVKRSATFVLVGSEGTHLSEPVANEIDLFLTNNKNKPLIPITIEGSINDRAIWYRNIFGLLLIDDSKENLKNATSSDDVLNRIENSLTFKKKSKKLRQTTIAILGIGILLSGYLVYQKKQNMQEAKRTQINLLHATARDYYIKKDYPKALNELIEISKIDDDSKESFNLLVEGVKECISKDNFFNGIPYLSKISELFSKRFPEEFSNIHCQFLFNESESLLKIYREKNPAKNDFINRILSCILNKIHSYPNYKDSVYGFFKNHYYRPLSTNTYSSKSDSYYLGHPRINLSISHNGDFVSWSDENVISIDKLNGEKVFSIKFDTIFKANYIRSSSAPIIIFSTDNSNKLVSCYSYGLKDKFLEFAIVYVGGIQIKRINNPVFISLKENNVEMDIKDDIYLNGNLSYKYCFSKISNDSIFLRPNENFNATYTYLDPVEISGIDKAKKLLVGKELVIKENNGDIIQKLETASQFNNSITYAKDSSLILVERSANTPNNYLATYLFDHKINFISVLRFSNNPVFIPGNKYILDIETQSLWYSDPKESFSERKWNSILTKEQKRRYGIEFN